MCFAKIWYTDVRPDRSVDVTFLLLDEIIFTVNLDYVRALIAVYSVAIYYAKLSLHLFPKINWFLVGLHEQNDQ